MFEPSTSPRVFGLAPGVDFATALVAGLRERMQGQPPEAMAMVELIVPTGRFRDAIRAAFLEAGPGYLPRIRPLSELAGGGDDAPSPLARLLELAQLVQRLLEADPALGPPSAALGLARSLAGLIDEMQDEGVSYAALAGLDMGDHAAHWQKSLGFLSILQPWIDATDGPAGQLRAAVAARIAGWQQDPPQHPVIIAGSTGSRGTNAELMAAVASLPQGALVLPGFDRDMPEEAWAALGADLRGAEDHPQARFRLLLERMSQPPVKPWADALPPDPARGRLVSLALRPAPVTDQWLAEGALLGDPRAALERVALIEAPGPRAEALAIARALVEALAAGKTAALVTADRTLARRVTVALARWHLTPDDSAGRPLRLTAPGRFLRQIALVFAGEAGAEPLIALLKHPLAHSGEGRGPHLRLTREWELDLRDRGIPFPLRADLERFTGAREERAPWAAWLSSLLDTLPDPYLLQPLPELLAGFRRFAEGLAGGPEAGSGELWKEAAGEAALLRLAALEEAAGAAAPQTAADLPALLEAALGTSEVRETLIADKRVMIWGTLEARARSADLVILGGLTEGVWPAQPAPDPWMSRPMRRAAGLRLPERQTGLSAHDFQIAAAAPEVVLSRALRSTDAETVPSRWLNRILNLTAGLEHGAEALEAARARGRHWLEVALAEEADLSHLPESAAIPAPRPSPAPPVAHRPAELRVTEVARLVRDPYALYARRVLGLRPLSPLTPEPDARLRGTVLHRLIEDFVAAHPPGSSIASPAFLALSREVLAREIPWASARLLWLSRLARTAGEFLDWHAECEGEPVLVEEKGALQLPGFTLIGQPDRIDRLPDGRLALYDYKTGTPPNPNVQKAFDKQLMLLAIMAESGAFKGLPAGEVAKAEYIGIGGSFVIQPAPVAPEDLAETRARLVALMARYRQPGQGYTARRAMQSDKDISDYDGLSRLGEWRVSDPAVTIPVGDHGDNDG